MNALATMLRERLKSLKGEMADLDRLREQLARHQETIEAALIQEEALSAGRTASGLPDDIPHDDPNASVSDDSVEDRQTVAELVLGILSTGPKTLEQLKMVAAPYFSSESKAPGRALNFALVGLQKGGRVERIENGVWQLSGWGKTGGEAGTPR
jgi:hypothetical protein